MDTGEPWYLGERAELLAMVTLTRLPGVSVEQPRHEHGLDLLVSLPSSRGGRVFGIQVKGVRDIRTAVEPDGRVPGPYVEQMERLAGDAPFPVGLLIFDMSDDGGYFGWYLEPSTAVPGSPASVLRNAEVCVERLSEKRLNRLAAEVTEWYEARVPSH